MTDKSPPPDEHVSPRQRWDQRYTTRVSQRMKRPSSFVRSCVERISTTGHALDVAAGAGRHTIFLARCGWRVDAVDISLQGARLSQQKAERLKLVDKIRWIVADVEQPWLPQHTYDLIVITNFLSRPLIPMVKAQLNGGGWVIYETFMLGKPSLRPEFLLKSGELVALFSEFEVLHYTETDQPVAQLWARKPNT